MGRDSPSGEEDRPGESLPPPVRRLRLLFLLPFPPRKDAHGGGFRVTGEIVERLAARHYATVLALRGPTDFPASRTLRGLAERLDEVVHDARPPSRLRLLAGTPSWVSSLRVPEFERRVSDVAQSFRPDVVQIEYPVMAQYLSSLSRPAPCILVEHDPAVAAATEVVREKTGLERLRARAELRAWRKFERRVLETVQASVVFSADDADALHDLKANARVVVIRPGVVVAERPAAATGDDAEVVFVGSFIHPPNVEAAIRLAQRIFPRVVEACPEAKLTLVGARPPTAVRDLEGTQTTVHADVVDVQPFLERAAVVVAPLQMGGGIRVKVLDALAAGKAVVASPRAVRGLSVVDGRHLLVAEGDDEFANAVVAVLRDGSRRAQLGAAAHAWATAELSWDRAVRAFESLYASLLDPKEAATRRS